VRVRKIACHPDVISLGTHEPEVLGARQPGIARLLQGPLFPHAIHGVMQVLSEMELVEHDLRRRLLEMGPRRPDARFPYVLGDDTPRSRPAARGQRRLEAIEALLLPILGQIEDPGAVQIGSP